MYLNDRHPASRFASKQDASVSRPRRAERRRTWKSLTVRGVLLVLLARGFVDAAVAQEAVRMSMAGAAAAQANQNALSIPGYYNLRLGPTSWRFGSGLALVYDDNIALSQMGQEGDFIYGPSVNAKLLWPITQIQSLNLSIGAGYSGYIQHSSQNRAFITPNSELSFNIYVGDFVINLHDRFSITENNYQDPTLAGSASYSEFQNSLGVSTIWDLNKVIVNFGYDHADNIELTGGLGQADQTQEIISSSASYTIKPGMLLGIQLGGALLNYSMATSNTPYTGALQWNAGPVFRTQVSEYLSVAANAGYVVNSPQGGRELSTARHFGGYYGTVEISHRLNKFVQYTLSGGRLLNSSLFGGATESYITSLSASWNLLRKISVSTSFNYQRGSEVGVSGGETYDQFGPSIQLSRPLTKKMTTTLGYQFLERGSSVPGRAYTLNVVSLGLDYQF